MHFCRFFVSVDIRAFSPHHVPPHPADFHPRPPRWKKLRPAHPWFERKLWWRFQALYFVQRTTKSSTDCLVHLKSGSRKQSSLSLVCLVLKSIAAALSRGACGGLKLARTGDSGEKPGFKNITVNGLVGLDTQCQCLYVSTHQQRCKGKTPTSIECGSKWFTQGLAVVGSPQFSNLLLGRKLKKT